MATKNLARTVIEGGRYTYNKWERRHSSAEERAEARDYCKRVEIDPEYAEEEEIDERRHVSKGFSDKLSPMYRWLEAQVDRPWSEVRSEVFQKFDTRTTAGRHITFDHLLRQVVDTESGFDNRGRLVDPAIPKEAGDRSGYWSYADYYVDQEGIFRKSPGASRRRFRYAKAASEKDFLEAGKWLNGRMIMEEAGRLHWVTANDGIWLASWIEPGQIFQTYSFPRLSYYLRDNGHHEVKHTVPATYGIGTYTVTYQLHSDFWNKVDHPFSFRQRGELNEEDAKYFKSLPDSIRADILSFTKNR